MVGEAHDGAEAVEQAARLRPDVVLMDLRMPGVDGLTAIEHLHRLPAPPRVVALTTFDVDDYVLRALHAGAAGFLLKSTAPGELVGLVRAAAAGATVLSPEATQRLLGAASGGRPATGPAAVAAAREGARAAVRSLTRREAEVLAGLGQGLSNQQIARRLHLSEATVKGYVSRVLEKLGCANRTQAGLLAHQAGVLPPATGSRRGNAFLWQDTDE